MKNTFLFVISRAVYTMAADLKITYCLAEICSEGGREEYLIKIKVYI